MRSFPLIISTFSLAVIISTSAFGQGLQPHNDPKYGPDSASRIECVKNISLYSEFYKQKNFKDASKPWRRVYDNCPQSSKNTFIRGASIYKNLIAVEKNKDIKNKLIDTLMQIYDKRIELFGEEGLVLGFKGADLYGYYGNSAADKVNPLLKKSCQLEGKETDAAIVTIYMQTTVDLFKENKFTPEDVISAYTLSMETIELAMKYNKALKDAGGRSGAKAEQNIPKLETSAANVEALFSECGAADCSALISIFEPKFAEMQNDIEWLKKTTKLLDKTDCSDKPFFATAAEQLYKLEPSAEAAHNLARLFLKREDYSKADGYYDEATKLQEDPATKAIYFYEWSNLAFAQSNFSKVRLLSRESLQNNPNDGRPLIMIGRAYAADAKNIGKETVEHNAVYWAAVDKFKEAKKIDPNVAAQADELITTFSKYFPNKEEAFMFGIQEGKPYTVGGWINETTIARF